MEPRPNGRKSARVDIRLDPEAKAEIAHAALLRRLSVSEFILSAALERSQEVIERSNVVRLSERDAERFLAALESPPEPSAKLREAAERYRKAIAEGELESR